MSTVGRGCGLFRFSHRPDFSPLLDKGLSQHSPPLSDTNSPWRVMEAAGKGGKAPRRKKGAGKGGKAPRQREEEKAWNMGDSPQDCPVCLMTYEETTKRPRTLPCGHTFCTLCINDLKEQGHVACPECRVRHAIPEGGQFLVNYVAETLIRSLRDATAAAAAQPKPSAGQGKAAGRAAGQRESAGLSRKMRSFLQEQEASVVAAIDAYHEVQLQLDQYQTTLTGWVEQQQQLEDSLQGLVDQSRSVRELLQEEKSRVAAKKEEAKKGEQQLQVTLDTLRTLATEQEAGSVVTEVVRCTGEAEQVVEECRESFPDADTVTTTRKVREASTAALEASKAIQETPPPVAGADLKPQPDPLSTIMNRLKTIMEPKMKAEDLRSLTVPARRLVEAGHVFGVHEVEGECRHARISLEGDQLYLHTLKELPLPLEATALQVREVMPPSPPCHVFLDLSWPGSAAPRRVKVHLSRDTPAARQFMLLCTGQRGASYAHTRLLGVGEKGEPGECVCGGDYERNDGKGGAALLPDIGKGDYWESGRAGAVLWWCDDPAQAAQFVIITRDCQDGDVFPDVFGEVVEGLHVVVEAARHENITDVTVADCGVVLRR